MIDAARDIELDTGPRAPERERLCVATRTVRPVSELIRFVIGPEGEPVPDLKRKLPGRGIWVTATKAPLARRSSARRSPAASNAKFACLRTSLPGPNGSSSAPSSMRWRSPARPVWWPPASARRLRRWSTRRSPACCTPQRPRPTGSASSTRSCAARFSGKAPAVVRIFDLGAIGFGIEPPKCDTCSPARRPCERDCFGALPAPGTVSDRRSAPEGRRGCAGLSRRGN